MGKGTTIEQIFHFADSHKELVLNNFNEYYIIHPNWYGQFNKGNLFANYHILKINSINNKDMRCESIGTAGFKLNDTEVDPSTFSQCKNTFYNFTYKDLKQNGIIFMLKDILDYSLIK